MTDERSCKYCTEEDDVIRNDKNGLHVLAVTKNILEDETEVYTLDMVTPFGLYVQPINYCPGCGRNLVVHE